MKSLIIMHCLSMPQCTYHYQQLEYCLKNVPILNYCTSCTAGTELHTRLSYIPQKTHFIKHGVNDNSTVPLLGVVTLCLDPCLTKTQVPPGHRSWETDYAHSSHSGTDHPSSGHSQPLDQSVEWGGQQGGDTSFR